MNWAISMKNRCLKLGNSLFKTSNVIPDTVNLKLKGGDIACWCQQRRILGSELLEVLGKSLQTVPGTEKYRMPHQAQPMRRYVTNELCQVRFGIPPQIAQHKGKTLGDIGRP